MFSKNESDYEKLQRLFLEFVDKYGEEGFEEILSNLDNPDKLSYRVDLVREHTSPVSHAPNSHSTMKKFFKKGYTDFIKYIYGVRLRTMAVRILPEQMGGWGDAIRVFTNLPKGWPFTKITCDEFESLYLLLEKLYFVQSGYKLGADDLLNIYFSGLDERLVFFLDEFDIVGDGDLPEPSNDYFKILKHVKYQNKNIKDMWWDLGYLIKTANRYYNFEGRLDGWEYDVLKMLTFCSAVSDGRNKIVRDDVVRAYNAYFKLLNTDVPKYKARQNIINTTNYDGLRAKWMYYTLRLTHGRNP